MYELDSLKFFASSSKLLRPQNCVQIYKVVKERCIIPNALE